MSRFSSFHSPIGSWSSLVFGEPHRGACLMSQTQTPLENADLLVALSRGPGRTTCLPFVAGDAPARWRKLDAANLRRTITPCIDSFSAEIESATLIFRVYTPHAAIPNPKRARSLQYAAVPGLLLKVTIDNSQSDEPATAFLGMNWRGEGAIHPIDWSNRLLCGVSLANSWALAAAPAPGQVFTILGSQLASALERAEPSLITDSPAGGVAFKVAARSTRTVAFSLAFCQSGFATSGIDSRYLYTTYFQRAEAAASFTLASAARIRESCQTFDARIAHEVAATRLALFANAARQYDACTQLIDAANIPYFAVLSGPRAWRNAIDAAVDHLPWELFRNPWVVRNIFDLYTASYSYADQTIFPDDGPTADMHEGGMAICHDMGAADAYSPSTASAAELTNTRGSPAI